MLRGQRDEFSVVEFHAQPLRQPFSDAMSSAAVFTRNSDDERQRFTGRQAGTVVIGVQARSAVLRIERRGVTASEGVVVA